MIVRLAFWFLFCAVNATNSAPQLDLFSLLSSVGMEPSSTNNSPSNLHPNLSTTSLDSNLAVQCYLAPRPGAPVLLQPVLVGAYFQAVHLAMIETNAMIPRTWDLGPDAKVQYVVNNVNVAMKVPWPPTDRVFQPIFAAHAAALIAETCLTQRWGYLGGSVLLYPPSDDFRVVVASPANPSINVPGVSTPAIG